MIADLKPYPAYKESGLPWLGQVPGHWEVSPLAGLARLKSVVNQPARQLLSVYLQRGVVRFTDIDEKRTNATSEDLSSYQAVDPGDFVLNNQQAWRGSVGVSDFSGIVSPAYLVLALSKQYLARYANMLFRHQCMVSQYLVCSKGVGTIQRNLYWPHLKRVGVVVPPADEQAAILRFLDWTNGRLERAIRAKRKVIALLNEQKQAIIHRAVTRGLDPSVPLKPSGIPWLGDIPKHWRTSRLSQLSTKIGDGLHGTPQYVDQSPYYFINGNNLVHGHIRMKSSTRCVSENEFKRCRVELDDSSVLLSINGTIGSVACYQGESIILGKSAAYINCGKDLARSFLFSFLRSPAVINFLRQVVTGTTIFNLSLASIRSLPIALPLVDEQLKIASAIEDMIAPVGSAISRLEREINLLREYRTCLIADVVTGKLDVREAAAKLPIETEDLEPPNDANGFTEADEEAGDTDFDAVPEETEA